MPNGLLALLLLLSALAGCAEESKNPDLKVACALTKCICTSGGGGLFTQKQTTTPVLWTDRGNAYCPEGFALRQADEIKKKNQYYTPY